MKTYDFQLILSEPATDADDERLFEQFEGRISSAVINGTPFLFLHLEGETMERTLQEALRRVRALGLSVERIELDPETVGANPA